MAEGPNEMWGTDATKVWTTEEGWATVFVAVDHGTGELVGIHGAKVGNRVGALEPIRQGVRRYFRGFGPGIAAGLKLRQEQLLWVRTFGTVEELRLALQEWLRVYNEHWLIARYGYRSPAGVRRDYLALQEAA